jgi:hypothetical protein
VCVLGAALAVCVGMCVGVRRVVAVWAVCRLKASGERQLGDERGSRHGYVERIRRRGSYAEPACWAAGAKIA